MTLLGYPVVIDPRAYVEATVRLTWRERLLSLRPWRKYRIERRPAWLVETAKGGRAYAHVHPALLEALELSGRFEARA